MTATEAPPVEPQTDDRPPLAPTRPTTPTPAERQAHALARGADATTPHALNGRADSLADQLTHTIDVRPRQAWRRWLGRPADRPTLAEAEAIAEMREPLDRPASVVVASVKGGVGKALGVSEPVLTPTGYREIGSLQVGDPVIGRDGRSHDVLGVFPQGERDLFEVAFSDGTKVLADADHIWDVQTNADRNEMRGECVGPGCERPVLARSLCSGHMAQEGRGASLTVINSGRTHVIGGRRLMTTAAIAAAGVSTPRKGGREKRNNFFVHATEPVHLPDRDLPMDPYLLGVLLGDGTLSGTSVGLSNSDPEVVAAAVATVPADVKLRQQGKYDYRITGSRGKGANGLLSILREIGLMGSKSADKFIPDLYLINSIANRLALLQGLMDTDGTPEGRTAAAASYSSASGELARGVQFLAESLGCVVTTKVRRAFYTYKGVKREGQNSHGLRIVPPAGIELFRLPRKAERMPAARRRPFRAIVSITPAGRGQAVCIAVDAPDNMFLTRSCVPTHNTSLTIGLGSAFAEALGGGVAALDNNELRGTLADRVAREPHDRTIGDLIAPPAADGRFNLDWWRSPDATSLQMRWNAHAQPCGLHVYGSDPHMDATVGIPALHYSLLADAISRFYPITIVDTGNSEVAPNWRAALALADVIVVPVKLRIDFLLPAARMLESLRAHGHTLDGRVVIAVSNGGMTVAPEAQQAADDWFADFPVVNIPFDQLIDSPHPIVWDRLQATTRAAYRQLGATTRRAITTQKEN